MFLEMPNSYEHMNKVTRKVKTHFPSLTFMNIALLSLSYPKIDDPFPNREFFIFCFFAFFFNFPHMVFTFSEQK